MLLSAIANRRTAADQVVGDGWTEIALVNGSFEDLVIGAEGGVDNTPMPGWGSIQGAQCYTYWPTTDIDPPPDGTQCVLLQEVTPEQNQGYCYQASAEVIAAGWEYRLTFSVGKRQAIAYPVGTYCTLDSSSGGTFPVYAPAAPASGTWVADELIWTPPADTYGGDLRVRIDSRDTTTTGVTTQALFDNVKIWKRAL